MEIPEVRLSMSWMYLIFLLRGEAPENLPKFFDWAVVWLGVIDKGEVPVTIVKDSPGSRTAVFSVNRVFVINF